MRILLADDDEQLQRALRITLTARGYEVILARDGAEAIDMAASRHPDLILLDLGMPIVEGVDVIRAVRAWSKVPILVLSGRTDSAEKRCSGSIRAPTTTSRSRSPWTSCSRVSAHVRVRHQMTRRMS